MPQHTTGQQRAITARLAALPPSQAGPLPGRPRAAPEKPAAPLGAASPIGPKVAKGYGKKARKKEILGI